mmetsp:Transcript_287/g.670  ORF Transcript_287/g.670 Transcript_287/m.670 type:complete len:200 (+) Transcript_287:1059-1658(+)
MPRKESTNASNWCCVTSCTFFSFLVGVTTAVACLETEPSSSMRSINSSTTPSSGRLPVKPYNTCLKASLPRGAASGETLFHSSFMCLLMTSRSSRSLAVWAEGIPVSVAILMALRSSPFSFSSHASKSLPGSWSDGIWGFSTVNIPEATSINQSAGFSFSGISKPIRSKYGFAAFVGPTKTVLPPLPSRSTSSISVKRL